MAPDQTPSETTPVRVLIADDHPLIREGLAAFIGRRRDMRVVAQAADGNEAVEMYRQHRPDVAVMDLRMGSSSGLEALKTIRAEDPQARVIVLSTFDADEDVFRCLQAGARGYVLKDSPLEELMATIHAVHGGGTRIPDNVAHKLCLHLTKDPLTPAEQKVLEHLASGKRNREIAASLHVTEGTVKTHVNSILAKLHARSRTEAVSLAISRGLVTLP